MKKIISFFFVLLFCSCGQTILDKPKNLLDKDKMSEVLVALSLNEQSVINFPKSNLESGALYVLQQQNVSSEDFVNSYNYYLVSKDLPKIIENAQEIIKKKDPKAEKFINAKLNGTQKQEQLRPIKFKRDVVR